MGAQKISDSDHVDGLQYAGDKSDSLVVDIDSFTCRDVPANPRISVSFYCQFGPMFTCSLISMRYHSPEFPLHSLDRKHIIKSISGSVRKMSETSEVSFIFWG